MIIHRRTYKDPASFELIILPIELHEYLHPLTSISYPLCLFVTRFYPPLDFSVFPCPFIVYLVARPLIPNLSAQECPPPSIANSEGGTTANLQPGETYSFRCRDGYSKNDSTPVKCVTDTVFSVNPLPACIGTCFREANGEKNMLWGDGSLYGNEKTK